MNQIQFKTHKNKLLKMTPTRLIALSFILLILIGTCLLMLPISSQKREYTDFLTALFTATSASCVTGLVVVDTGTYWSMFGQLTILFLIQAGGLGLVTLATSFSMILGRKISLQGKRLALESTNYFSYENILSLVKKIVLITLTAEILGAIVLSFRFYPKYQFRGIYMGIFHSISAFCNSGFDILGDYKSLIAFQKDPLFLLTIAALVVIGGLGFMVWDNLLSLHKTKTLLLHTKIVLWLSGVFILLGALLFLFLEHANPYTIGSFSNFHKMTASLFHSIVTRTAGFNTLALNEMTETSKILTILFMFVGASPGSTGGGIKVTTFAVILIAIWSEIRGYQKTVIFNHRISGTIVFKALSILGLAGFWIITTTTWILLLEKNMDISFINVLYEVTSAFGTVGLSALGTSQLSSPAKIWLILTMFIGRLGPLTFAISIALRKNKGGEKIYPEGKVLVG
jgi:trk system potassium uptake protein